LRKKFLQQRGEEGLRGIGDAGKRMRFAIFQSPRETLRTGNFQNVSEQIACR
jgi:hypothetical protein